MKRHPLILHVDADAFYASVEQVLHPELRGKAVIVGVNNRGVVSAASYEARRFGVHSAMPVAQARRLCPHGVFLEPNFSAYSEYSRRMFEIMRRYSPAVEETSVDEGYVDLSGTLRLHKAPPWEVAHRMLQEIRITLEINVSGGLAGSKMAAKMATGLAKPNGLLYLEPEKAWMVLGRLPVGSIPGVGKKTEKILQSHGITTVAHLAASPGRLVGSLLGQWGEKLSESAAGNDHRPVRVAPAESQKSYSKERTLAEDTTDYNLVRHVACEIAEKLTYRLREDGKGASTVTLKVRYADFTQTSRSISLREPTDANAVIFACLDRLFGKAVTRRQRIRQVGVKLSGIGPPVYQEDLFESRSGLTYRKDRLTDAIRSRFGFGSVRVADCFLQGHRRRLK